MTANQAYALAKKFTEETVEGAGAIKGKSAYELAVEKGYSGSEADWLESLKSTGFRNAYIFEQNEPAEIWEIIHSLNNQYPVVVCIDNDGDQIVGDISYDSPNMLTVIFSAAVTGKAFIK